MTAQEEVVELCREGSIGRSVLEDRLEKDTLKKKKIKKSSALSHCHDRVL